ncbi:MAG: hypothetical protein E7099_09800 [Mediterranea massiliensis]|nr:hypothetical protein [Mediterranea massiliensis]
MSDENTHYDSKQGEIIHCLLFVGTAFVNEVQTGKKNSCLSRFVLWVNSEMCCFLKLPINKD